MEDELLFQLMRGQGMAEPVTGPEIGPVTLTDDMRDTMNVVRPNKRKKSQSVEQMKNAIRNAFIGGGVDLNAADRAAEQRKQEQAPEALLGLGAGNIDTIGSGDQYMQNMLSHGRENPLLKNQGDIELLQGLMSGGQPSGGGQAPSQAPQPNAPSGNPTPLSVSQTDVPDLNAGDLDMMGEFQGTQIEGVTPRGVPEAEELSGLGKAISGFSKALETPGFQKFLGQMGMAFGQGDPSSPGTILGQQAVQGADAEVERRLVEGLMSGKDISEIELEGAPTSEALSNAFTLRQRQDAQELDERTQDFREETTERQLDMSEEEQAFNQWATNSRIAQQWKRIGLEEDRLDLNRLEAVSALSEESKPEDVESWQHGVAAETVSQKYLDLAKKFRDQSLGTLSTMADFQNAVSNEKTGYDPQAVISYLPENLRQQAMSEIQQMSKVVQADASGKQQLEPEAFQQSIQNVGIQTAKSQQELSNIQPGQYFRLPNGKVMQKTKGGAVEVFNEEEE